MCQFSHTGSFSTAIPWAGTATKDIKDRSSNTTYGRAYILFWLITIIFITFDVMSHLLLFHCHFWEELRKTAVPLAATRCQPSTTFKREERSKIFDKTTMFRKQLMCGEGSITMGQLQMYTLLSIWLSLLHIGYWGTQISVIIMTPLLSRGNNCTVLTWMYSSQSVKEEEHLQVFSSFDWIWTLSKWRYVFFYKTEPKARV